MKEPNTTYNKQYPTYMTNQKLMWITEVGDLLEKEGKTYKVVQVLRPRIEGATPKLVLQEIER